MNKKVAKLFNLPQPAQRSEAWFRQRNKQITASEVASCLFLKPEVVEEYNKTFPKAIIKANPLKGANSYERLDEYIKKKCNVFYSKNYEPFRDTIYTLHGKLYEPVATRFYSINKKCNVNEFGLITHPKLPWLAASPDGITDDGVMLEIKCPLSRKISLDSIPFGYWLQTQIQMEVCDLDSCDFLECEITPITERDFLETEEKLISEGLVGIILEKDTEPKTYIYPDAETASKLLFDEFTNKNPELGKMYYKINNWNIITLPRSKTWFKNIKADLYTIYKRIQRYQQSKEAYDKYLETLVGPLYKKSLVVLDKKEIEYSQDIITIDFDLETCSESTGTDTETETIEISCDISFETPNDKIIKTVNNGRDKPIKNATETSVSCNISFEMEIS